MERYGCRVKPMVMADETFRVRTVVFPAKGGEFMVSVLPDLDVRITRAEAKVLYKRCQHTNAMELQEWKPGHYIFTPTGY